MATDDDLTPFDYCGLERAIRAAFPSAIPNIVLRIDRQNYSLGRDFWVELFFARHAWPYSIGEPFALPPQSPCWFSLDASELKPNGNNPKKAAWNHFLTALDDILPRLTPRFIFLPPEAKLLECLECYEIDSAHELGQISVQLTIDCPGLSNQTVSVAVHHLFPASDIDAWFEAYKPQPYRWTPGYKYL